MLRHGDEIRLQRKVLAATTISVSPSSTKHISQLVWTLTALQFLRSPQSPRLHHPMMACPFDHSIGPVLPSAHAECRAFDFTVAFEDVAFTLVPNLMALLLVVCRIKHVFGKPKVVDWFQVRAIKAVSHSRGLPLEVSMKLTLAGLVHHSGGISACVYCFCS